ncbi:hypothetical protein HSX10_03575 [Winogradskyella undariae]|uniref:DUF6046 domain-containing protein n=1 Tax=Winogradskyella undariae TaxID=1285465 RepID=UPI00156B32E8|nr:DUF6046 domain-containing protein [Winogradskyella undariae]NRR90639.1 hypothetical protein [Winogradskyella undariae]
MNAILKLLLNAKPFLSNDVTIAKSEGEYSDPEIWKADEPLHKNNQYFPLAFKSKADTQAYYLPYEPILDITGRNQIIRRYPVKYPKDLQTKASAKKTNAMIGSIKEHWNSDDYEITIRGVLIGSIISGNVEQCYPREDFERLKDYVTKAEALDVFSEPLQLLGINQVVVESFTFPFTKGENVQAYEIKAYSSQDPQVLIQLDDKAQWQIK